MLLLHLAQKFLIKIQTLLVILLLLQLQVSINLMYFLDWHKLIQQLTLFKLTLVLVIEYLNLLYLILMDLIQTLLIASISSSFKDMMLVYDWDATTRLKQLKPARFNFIIDADKTVDGFLAHEAQCIVPESVK